MKLLNLLDKRLNDITMYRLLVYGLSAVLFGATLLSLTGRLSLSASAIVLSVIVIISVGSITDRLLSTLFETYTNNDSSLITCLILCCILPPMTSLHGLALLALGTLFAIASKFVLAFHRKHIFNPAALGALILGVSRLLPATWWIGSPSMLPLSVIFGLLVLRKVRRFRLFASFLMASLVVTIALGFHHDLTLGYSLKTAFASSPLIFLGSVMLTEPSTTPPVVRKQLIYGLLVGLIFTSQLRLGSLSATPEIALVLGNLYAYAVSPKYKLRLRLKHMQQLAPRVYDFSFSGAQSLAFTPGQYLEWTLPRTAADNRGNRRIFSIASAPGEDEIHIAIKVPATIEATSSFKKQLTTLAPGRVILAGQLSGDFILPKALQQKLVFIAGGIGITPFLSMVKHMLLTGQKRDIILFYLVATPDEYCYAEVWKQAERFGVKVIPLLTSREDNSAWQGLSGRLTAELLLKQVPDYLRRTYYLSGPSALVDDYSKLLLNLKIKRQAIITDHFSGY